MHQFQVSVSDFISRNENDIHSVYRIGKQVGDKGAYGYIRYCIHRKTGNLRALKIIGRQNLQHLDNYMHEFNSEISILSKLDHPGIMRVFEWFADTKRFYLITDLYQGGELHKWITRRIRPDNSDSPGRVDEDDAREIIKQLLGILRYLHSMGVVHRDIKPENLIFIEEGNIQKGIQLVDFGLAKELEPGNYIE